MITPVDEAEIQWVTAGDLTPQRPARRVASEPARRRRIAEMTLEEFTGGKLRFLSEAQFGSNERMQIEIARDMVDLLPKMLAGMLSSNMTTGRWKELKVVHREDCRFTAFLNNLVVTDRYDGSPLGGIYQGVLYIKPEARGRGIARDMHINLQDWDKPMLNPSHYSESGYAARLAAHREATLMDYQAGLRVHHQNLERYAAQIADLATCDEGLSP